MKRLAAIVLCALLCGCNTFHQAAPEMGCGLYALRKQAELAQAYLGNLVWNKILVVKFTKGDRELEHAYVIAKSLDGVVCSWDSETGGGMRFLKRYSIDALEVAEQLHPKNVIVAYYPEKEKHL